PRRARRSARVPVLASRRGAGLVLARRRLRLRRPQAAVTERPRVVVMGLAEARWPEGAKAVAEVVDLAFATRSEPSAKPLPQAEILLPRPSEDRGMLPKAWRRAGRPRWIQ